MALSLECERRIKELYEIYQISGDPLYVSLIYHKFGIDGALYMKKYDVASNMIKKDPSLINEVKMKDEEKYKIYELILNDFRYSVDILNKFDNPSPLISKKDRSKYEKANGAFHMILDLAKEININPRDAINDKDFLLEIYSMYLETEYEDLELLKTIICSPYVTLNEIVNLAFEKNVETDMVYEVGGLVLNAVAVEDLYIDFIKVLVYFYIKLHQVIETNENEEIGKHNLSSKIKNAYEGSILDIKKYVCSSLKTLDTDVILSVLRKIDRIERYMDIDTHHDMFDELSIKEELLQYTEDYLREEISMVIEELKERGLREILYELTHETGMRRVGIMVYMKEYMSEYNTTGFYDLDDEIKLFEKLGEYY